jgi:hypothetical protein
MERTLLRWLRHALPIIALLAPASAWPLSTGLVISQVYGGGGNAGATYTHDFVELHNNSGAPIPLAGMAIQYAAAAGSTWTVTPLPLAAAAIPSGGYYLIQLASNGAIGLPLPTPDATGTSNMGATAGKVALTSNTTTLTGACPVGPSVIDFVGYGSTANCFEGTGPAPSIISNTLAAVRKVLGCQETDDNAADFLPDNVVPRNSAMAPYPCGEFAMNETNDPSEADYCVLQFPSTISGVAGSTSPLVYARLFEAGVTESRARARGSHRSDTARRPRIP